VRATGFIKRMQARASCCHQLTKLRRRLRSQATNVRSTPLMRGRISSKGKSQTQAMLAQQRVLILWVSTKARLLQTLTMAPVRWALFLSRTSLNWSRPPDVNRTTSAPRPSADKECVRYLDYSVRNAMSWMEMMTVQRA
jgi:hypothetical protein